MTALAAVLMVGGVVAAVLFAVGAVAVFVMLISSEISLARSRRAEKTETATTAVRTMPVGGISIEHKLSA